MPNKSTIFLFVILFCILFISAPSNAWLRDADIKNTSDSIGIGWLSGLNYTYEKKIFDMTSFGIYYRPGLFELLDSVR